MINKLNTPVSVACFYNHRNQFFSPVRIFWSGREFRVDKLGLYHHYRQGQCLYHVFSVVSGQLCFRLELNGSSLNWLLKEVSDGLPN